MIEVNRVVQWMNVIRETPYKDQYRLLENFWSSQLNSKMWLVNTLKMLNLVQQGNVYIFGGWYGVLASLIKDNFNCDTVYSIDLDPSCRGVGKRLDNRIKFVTCDMIDMTKDEILNPKLIINTSTEHVSQDTFNTWLSNMPNGVPIILQGNNYFSCKEHIRCSETLEKFNEINRLNKIVYSGSLDCKEFTRFMSIGYKHES